MFFFIVFFSSRLFEPAQMIDLIKGFVLIGCGIPMAFMDISVVYHTVRAQAAIKLYMFFNMLEVSDRLLSSFGQDTLDAVYWTATDPRRKASFGKLLLWLIIAIIYCSEFSICPFFSLHFVFIFQQFIRFSFYFKRSHSMSHLIRKTKCY